MHLHFPHGLLLLLSLLLSLSAVHGQQPDTLLHSVPPPPTGIQSGSQLGYSVAADAGFTVVGAPLDDIGGTDAGVVKVFDSATGALLHLIPNPNPAPGDNFGWSVAISGSRVVVGAYRDDTGATDAGSAYVYDLSSSNPSLPIVAIGNPSPTATDWFGWSVAISGTRVVVGAEADDTGASNAGSAYVYDLTSVTPTVPVTTLNNPSAEADDYFGNAVAISGTRIVIGARLDDTGALSAGSAYVYDLSSGTPTLPMLTLNNPGPPASDSFGQSVAISGTRVVVGAHADDTGASNAGSAYVYDVTSGTPTVPFVTLNNPSPAANDFFGNSVAISGTRVVVGAYADDTGASSAGSAYVYDISSGTPSVPAVTLNNPSPAPDDNFGSSVTISGTHVAVGAFNDDTGASDAGSAYSYEMSSGTPSLPIAALASPSPASGDKFGQSVAVSGTLIVVGAPYENTGAIYAGSAFVYDLSSGTPTVPVATLNNPSPAVFDLFGGSVAISGTRVVVSAEDGTGGYRAGSAYVYDLSSVTPTVPMFTINNPSPAANDVFGSSVAISGTRVVVGANQDDTGATDAGRVYVYNLSGGNPTIPVNTLNNPSPAANDMFGSSVAISGTRVVVGANQDDTGASDAGSVYVYDLSSGTPTVPVVTLNNPGPAASDYFGISVSISGTRVVVGANQDDTGASDAGSVYVYDLSSGTPTVPVVTLNNPGPAASDYFGNSVSISGTRVVVGANQDDTAASDAGIAYVYDLSSETPTVPVVTFNNPGPAASDNFGNSVSISGTRVVVGAYADDSAVADKGYAYVFGPSDTTTATPTLIAPAPNTLTNSPISVSFSLPETALPGSLKLSFGATQLTLAPVQETAGAHNLSFNPANPTASSDIASGSPIGDGVYTVTLAYQDLSENPVASVSSTNVKVDTLSPVLSPVTIVSSNANSVRAKLGDTITLSFSANEAIQTPVVTLLGVAASTSNPSGNNWIATATVTAETSQGAATFSVTATDLAGNTAIPVTSTTNASSVTVDMTAPVLSPVTIASSNANSSRAKLSDTVTLSFTASEALQTPIVTLLGVAAAVGNPGGNNWTAAAAVVAGTVQGTAIFSISVTDLAGNASTPVTATSNASGVIVDKTSPTLSPVTITSSNANSSRAKVGDTVTVSFTANETIQTPVVTLMGVTPTLSNPSGNSWTAMATVTSGTTQGNATFSILARDSAGNAASSVTATTDTTSVTVDRVTQVPTILNPASNARTKSPVIASFILPEAALSGSLKLSFGANELTLSASQETAGTHSFTFDPANPTASAEVASGSAIMDGTYTVKLSYQDALGNTAAQTQSTGVVVDTLSLSPTLTAPASNTSTTSPITVSFSLPEGAFPGTVKLFFGATQLTLAAAHEAAGSHSFSFDPANPTASSHIASGSAIADGTYTLTLSYQDNLGNLASEVQSTNVMVDTITLTPTLMAPSSSTTTSTPIAVSFTLPEAALAGSVKLSFGTIELNLASSQETAGAHSFTFDPLNPTASPEIANGARVPNGTYTVTLSYQDAAGNAVVSATSTTVVIDRAPALTTQASKGGAVPGAGVMGSGIPAGAVWHKLGVPALGDGGQTALLADWKVGTKLSSGLFYQASSSSLLSLLRAKASAVPGVTNTVFSAFKDPLVAPDGAVVWHATLGNAPGTTGAVKTSNNAAIFQSTSGMVARKGDVAAGTASARWASFDSLAVSEGAVAFVGKLVVSSSAGVSEASDQGLWIYDRDTAVTSLMIREGDVLLGSKVKVIGALATRTKAGGQGRGVMTSSSEDQIALRITLTNGKTALGVVSSPGGVSFPYQSGMPTVGFGTGALWSSFGLPGQNSPAGALCFLGTVKAGTGTATATNNIALFSEDDTILALTKRYGLKDSAGITGGVFSGFSDPVNGSGGALAFIGSMANNSAAGITSGGNDGVWYDNGSVLSLIAREGAQPPGVVTGARWKSFTTVALPEGRGPIFVATLEVGRAGITTGKDKGVWATDSAGSVKKLIQEGDPIGTSKVASFQVLSTVSGSPAQTRSFNSAGEVVMQVTDAAGGTHLVHVAVP